MHKALVGGSQGRQVDWAVLRQTSGQGPLLGGWPTSLRQLTTICPLSLQGSLLCVRGLGPHPAPEP